MKQEPYREMIQQADDFSFPAIADHGFTDFTASFWCSSGRVSNCSFPISSDGDDKQEEDFEFKPEIHLRENLSSMDRLWEDGDGGKEIEGLQKEFGSSDSARSLPCQSPLKLIIGEDGRRPSLEEEKMDMLWEDFNDELCEKSDNIGGRSNGKIDGSFETGIDSDSDIDGPEMGEFYCAQALKISKRSSFRRHNFLVILKVLKKLFLLHNSHYSHKN